MKNYYDMLLKFVFHSIQALTWEVLSLLTLRVNDVSESKKSRKSKSKGLERHYSAVIIFILGFEGKMKGTLAAI